MATIYRRGKKWRAQVRLKGINDSGDFPTKVAAQEWTITRESEILAEGGIVVEKHTLADTMLRYRDEVSIKKRGADKEIIRINAFINNLPFIGLLLEDVTPEKIAKYRDERLAVVKSGTVRRELNLLDSILEVARREWRWCKANPVKDVKKPPEDRHRDRRILPAEELILLEKLKYIEGKPPVTMMQEVAYAFLIAIETAMRQGEILSLTRDAVFLDKRFVHLDKTKNGDTRDVALSKRACELFKQVLANTTDDNRVFRVQSNSADTLFRKAKKAAGVENLHFHDTRHEATTRLAKKLAVLDLARMTGHRDPRSLMIYYNETAEEIAAKLD